MPEAIEVDEINEVLYKDESAQDRLFQRFISHGTSSTRQEESRAPLSKAKRDSDSSPSEDPVAASLSHESTDWMMRARCSRSDVDPDVFFPPGRETPAARNYRVSEALKFCGECAVKQTCADYGLKLHKYYNGVPGIFGGKDEVDRKDLV